MGDGDSLFNKSLLNIPMHSTLAGTKGEGKMCEALSLSSRNLQDKLAILHCLRSDKMAFKGKQQYQVC